MEEWSTDTQMLTKSIISIRNFLCFDMYDSYLVHTTQVSSLSLQGMK